jgi:hypothetical protein
VIRERSVTDPGRWNEVMQAYGAAQRAVTEQIARWQEEARRQLVGVEAGAEADVRAAGVPEEHVPAETAALKALFAEVRGQLGQPALGAQPTLGLYEAQRLLGDLTAAKLNARTRLGELRGRYQVNIEPLMVHLVWNDLAGTVQIASVEDLEDVLERLRRRIQAELSQQHKVTIG